MEEATSRRSSFRQYILVGVLVLAGAILAFGLWYSFLRTSYESAFTGLRSNDAMTIKSELDRLKTPYKLTDGGSTILVPADQVDATRINVLGGDLPLKGAVGFELFNKTDMGLTEFAQKINYQRALQGELARTIMALDEVDTARVHLSLPEAGIFEQDRRVAKASVTVATKTSGGVAAATVRGIQQLVASAVPELQAANVAILDAKGQLLSDAPPIILPDAASNNPHEVLGRQSVDKIRQALREAGYTMPVEVAVTSQSSGYDQALDKENDGKGAGQGNKTNISENARPASLNIQLILGGEPGVGIRDRMLAVVKQAVSFDQTRGDTLTISIDPSFGQPQPKPIPVVPTPTKDIAAVAPLLDIPATAIWLSFAGLVLLTVLFAFWRLSRRRVPLTLSERDAFSARLRALLDEESANGKSPA